MNKTLPHACTSIGKKQIVASSGLFLILYVIVHLAGNLFIYAGPKAFNGYADKLASLRPALSFIEVGLLLIFLVHIYFTVLLAIENRRPSGALRKYQQSGPAFSGDPDYDDFRRDCADFCDLASVGFYVNRSSRTAQFHQRRESRSLWCRLQLFREPSSLSAVYYRDGGRRQSPDARRGEFLPDIRLQSPEIFFQDQKFQPRLCRRGDCRIQFNSDLDFYAAFRIIHYARLQDSQRIS